MTVRHRRLDGAVSRLFRWPVRFGAPRRREVVTARLAVAVERLRSLVRRRGLELAGRTRALGALSPAAVLARGYSITALDGDAAPLKDAGQVSAGARLITTLAVGSLRSVVVGRGVGAQAVLFDAPSQDPDQGAAPGKGGES